MYIPLEMTGLWEREKKITNDDFVAITSQSIELYEASNYSESCKQYMYAFYLSN